MAPKSGIAAAQRAAGALDLRFHVRAGVTRVATFFQDGCLKARLPRRQDAATLEAVLINLSGGVAGGDHLATVITLGPGAAAMVASQAAERFYRALDAPARVATRLTLGPAAGLDYLPQETILFNGFALDRALDIDIAADARFLGLEMLVFGRQAHGEILARGDLRDRITLRRNQAVILTDMTRLNGAITAQLARPAIAAGAGALATLIYAAPDAAARLAPLRDALTGQAGASLIDNVIFARLLAPDQKSLRHAVLAALVPLRDRRPLPGVWAS